MSSTTETPTERFKRVLAQATKALSAEPDVEVAADDAPSLLARGRRQGVVGNRADREGGVPAERPMGRTVVAAAGSPVGPPERPDLERVRVVEADVLRHPDCKLQVLHSQSGRPGGRVVVKERGVDADGDDAEAHGPWGGVLGAPN